MNHRVHFFIIIVTATIVIAFCSHNSTTAKQSHCISHCIHFHVFHSMTWSSSFQVVYKPSFVKSVCLCVWVPVCVYVCVCVCLYRQDSALYKYFNCLIIITLTHAVNRCFYCVSLPNAGFFSGANMSIKLYF